jgi:hypothetical protein
VSALRVATPFGHSADRMRRCACSVRHLRILRLLLTYFEEGCPKRVSSLGRRYPSIDPWAVTVTQSRKLNAEALKSELLRKLTAIFEVRASVCKVARCARATRHVCAEVLVPRRAARAEGGERSAGRCGGCGTAAAGGALCEHCGPIRAARNFQQQHVAPRARPGAVSPARARPSTHCR